MTLARKELDHPDRMMELQEQVDIDVAEVVLEITDAGYTTDEALKALALVVKKQGRTKGRALDPS